MISLERLRRPLCIGALTSANPVSVQCRPNRIRNVDVIEIRLDTFSEIYAPLDRALPFAVATIRKVKAASRKPILLTIRRWQETGNSSPSNRLPEASRLKLLVACLPLAHMVDIEIQASALVATVTALAHKQKKLVVHSYHNFKGMTPFAKLNRWADVSRRAGGDIFKIAMTPTSDADVRNLLWWAEERRQQQCAAIAMGKIGEASRLLGFTFGSCLSFGHLGNPSAPGQISASELGRRLKSIYA